jgi:hypothetical protein
VGKSAVTSHTIFLNGLLGMVTGDEDLAIGICRKDIGMAPPVHGLRKVFFNKILLGDVAIVALGDLAV